ncbi:MAG TPA: hypothetical protein VHM90_17890 [Phycisphaerae bacterium]|jgi:hypothetical protein|nr:hypothetical protein [Phycisphaerae bacterium]
MRRLTRYPRTFGLVLCALVVLAAFALSIYHASKKPVSGPDAARLAAPEPAVAESPVPTAPAGKGYAGCVLLLGAIGALLGMCWGASTQFGTSDGDWNTAANWSNGVPTASLSAIVSTTSGVAVLPDGSIASATCKNLTGGGSIGLCGGRAVLNIVAPSANTALRMVAVDAIEAKTATNLVPRGHS